MRSKGQTLLNFGYHVNFDFLYQTLRVFSQIKDRKHIEQNFHSVAGVVPQGWDFGALGVPREVQIFFFKHGHVAY